MEQYKIENAKNQSLKTKKLLLQLCGYLHVCPCDLECTCEGHAQKSLNVSTIYQGLVWMELYGGTTVVVVNCIGKHQALQLPAAVWYKTCYLAHS